MIRLDMPQGSEDWIKARLGIPTASCFGQLITAKSWKPSASAGKYLDKLIVEWLTGQSQDDAVSQFMDRGKELEEAARSWYELQTDEEAELVGFCLSDDRQCGCSPDALIGGDGLLEIKCPGMLAHVGYMRQEPPEHTAQVQGQLWITNRGWCDLLAFHPELPPVLVRIDRDEEFIKALAREVDKFCARLREAKEKLVALGHHPPEQDSWLKKQLEASLHDNQ